MSVGKRRVLVVDDDPDIRALLVAVLTDDGYDAAAAHNGRDALAILERWPADVIVLDLMMPVMDGWTFAEALRAKEWQIPIVVLSAIADLTRNGRRVGAAQVVPKPFDLETLLPAIQRVTGGTAA